MTLSAHDWIRLSLIWLLKLSNIRYSPLLLESFFRLWLFSFIPLDGSAKETRQWECGKVLGVRE